MRDLTPIQIAVVQALATGATVTAAAAQASIARTTIYRWLDNPVFRRAIAFAQQEYAITIKDRMQGLAAKALDRLEAVPDNPRSSPSVILKASLAILNPAHSNWNLPAPSLQECAQVIAAAEAEMEETNQSTQPGPAGDVTKSYTKSNSQPGVACPCGSGLFYRQCCGEEAPPVPNNRAA